jgi:hypothetical protein
MLTLSPTFSSSSLAISWLRGLSSASSTWRPAWLARSASVSGTAWGEGEEGAPFVRRPAGGQGQHGPEAAALAEQAVGADLPAHQLDQPAADGEAQAGAAVLAGRRVVGLFEGFEELFLLGRAEADAVSSTSRRSRTGSSPAAGRRDAGRGG